MGPPTPSPVSECITLPPWNKGGGHNLVRVRGWGSPNSDDWRKSLALCLLCDPTRQLSDLADVVRRSLKRLECYKNIFRKAVDSDSLPAARYLPWQDRPEWRHVLIRTPARLGCCDQIACMGTLDDLYGSDVFCDLDEFEWRRKVENKCTIAISLVLTDCVDNSS